MQRSKISTRSYVHQAVLAVAAASALAAMPAYASQLVYDNATNINNNPNPGEQNNTETSAGVNDNGSDFFSSVGVPDTFIGSGLNLAPGTTSISGFDVFPTNATNASNIDPTGTGISFTDIKINIYVWGGVNSGLTTPTNPAFTDLLTPTPISYSFNFGTGGTFDPGYYLALQNAGHTSPYLGFYVPLTIPSSTIGLTVEVQGSTDGGTTYADYNGLSSLVAGSPFAPTVGSDTQEGWYRNANSETNGNFTSSLRSEVGVAKTDTYTDSNGKQQTYVAPADEYEAIGTDVFSAANYHWATPAYGTFSDPTQWTPNGVPGAGDSATFNLSSGGYTVEIADYETFTTGSIQNDNVTFDLGGVTSQLYIYGALTVGQPAVTGGSATGSLTLTNSLNNQTNLAEAGSIAVGGNGGTGKLTVTQAVYLYCDSDVSIGAGSSLVIAPGGKLETSTLTLAGTTNAWTGTLDIGQSALDITGGDIGTVMNQLKTGFNGGTWTGKGIISSAAAADPLHLTAVGAILNNDGHGNRIYGVGTALGRFDDANELSGIDNALTDVLVKYTYYGDANLDGVVDGSDYTLIDNGFANHLTGWYNGDFNYDGVVDGSDYTLIDNAFNTQGSSLGLSNAAIPGEASLAGSSRITEQLMGTTDDGGMRTVDVSQEVPLPSGNGLAAISTAQIAASSVPEPASLALLAAGLLPLRRRRRSVR
jgi:MYXO-CTERM domain-containing protein